MYDIRFAQATHQGLVRSNNEDAMVIEDPGQASLREKKGVLFAVADGLGGLDQGEVASRTAVDEVRRLFHALPQLRDGHWLREAVEIANEQIFNLNKGLVHLERMATTLTLSVFKGGRVYVGHVGDSRLYRVRSEKITRLTTDHSIDRHTLTRVVGLDSTVIPELCEFDLEHRDRYIQCSDGLYASLSDGEILRIALKFESPQEAVSKLIEAANAAGGIDNTTVQVIDVRSL
jgi:protein phosphatase